MNIKINIIYEDNHLLVVEKPVNILTQGDVTGDTDLLTLLKDDIRIRYNKPGDVFLGLIHRLDRPVGGAMVFARTSKAASRLSEQVRTREFKKTYLAVAHGIPLPSGGRLEDYLVKDNRTNMVSIASETDEGSKRAVLDYEVKGVSGNLSLIRVSLLTGRSHQIRVQLAAAGHPLFGDQKYGASVNVPGEQIALWSAEISFKHPTSKEDMVFKSLPPANHPWNMFHIDKSLNS
jgi:23S rRNA pseudouridine1911/1915/1917 synthase